MKILHVCPRYNPFIGGVEEHVRNICERLVEKHDVEVYTTDPSKSLSQHEMINHVKVTRFPSWAPNEAYYFSSKLKKQLNIASSDFDVVHAHNYAAFPALYAAQTKAENNFFFTPHYHGTGHTFLRSLLHKPYKFWGKRIFEKAEKVICVSRFEMDLVTRDFKNLEDKLVLVPNGLNMEEFKYLEKRQGERKHILSVCRLERYKGIQYIIEALPSLSENTVLDVVGKGPYRKVLVDTAKRMNVLERVKFYDFLPRTELLQKYADADVFVLLSEHESYGISVAEAFCAGTPCIVANKSALTEWVDNERCFGIDYPLQIDRLAKLIQEVISEKINVKGTGLWSWKEVVLKLATLYENSIT
jgi:glycosyltransferase involved in cell wall biosynthesis